MASKLAAHMPMKAAAPPSRPPSPAQAQAQARDAHVGSARSAPTRETRRSVGRASYVFAMAAVLMCTLSASSGRRVVSTAAEGEERACGRAASAEAGRQRGGKGTRGGGGAAAAAAAAGGRKGCTGGRGGLDASQGEEAGSDGEARPLCCRSAGGPALAAGGFPHPALAPAAPSCLHVLRSCPCPPRPLWWHL